MARAYKCDRCGAYYDTDIPVNELSIVYRYGYTTDHKYNLCEKCGNELVKFFKNEPLEVTVKYEINP